ncbi:MAG TPA: lipid II flippase MurJ, partial [Anaerolineales bacterium]|nr:lipid II flippase MurJ [Anaerolineales bacterium]
MNKVALDSIVVTVLNGMAQAASFLLFAVIAALFGANWQTDAFFLAFSLPTIVIGTSINVIASVFIPLMTEWRIQHPEALGSLIGSALAYGFIFSGVSAVCIALIAPAILGTLSIVPGVTQQLAVMHMRMLSPMIVVQTLIGLVSAVYNSGRRFWWPALTASLRFA